jgi:NAD(P)-dependent dehydrogenase (short-subunit alcohol dehydrogenase family)
MLLEKTVCVFLLDFNSFAETFIVSQKDERLLPYRTDVTSLSSLLELTTHIKARHGYIDLLVNNAGIARGFYPKMPGPCDDGSASGQITVNADGKPSVSPESSSMKSTSPSSSSQPSIQAFQQALWSTSSPDDFAQSFATNVTAPYYTTVAFLELLHAGNLRRQQLQDQNNGPLTPNLPYTASNGKSNTSNGASAHGIKTVPPPPVLSSHVITVSSSGSFRTDAGVVSPSYTVSKCAATHLGCVLANILAPWGIRSNILAPGVWPSG